MSILADSHSPLQARDKLTFLLTLVPYLMDHDRVSVTEAAQQFGVSEPQIREAVRLIAVSGVPGDTSTYQHDDLFDIAWDDFEDNDQIVLTNLVAIDDSPRFSGREAAALIAGLQYLSALPENADRQALAQLMAKLSRGASTALSAVAIDSGESDASLAVIRDAVAAGRQVKFDYVNSHGVREERTVDPLRIESVDADWYLRGWCHLREAVRTFRLDRIGNLTLTTEDISFRPEDVTLPDALFEGSPDDIDVTLSIGQAALSLVADYRPEVLGTDPSTGLIRARIRVSSLQVIARLASGMPGLITVLGPPEARDLVAEWAAEGLRQYHE